MLVQLNVFIGDKIYHVLKSYVDKRQFHLTLDLQMMQVQLDSAKHQLALCKKDIEEATRLQKSAQKPAPFVIYQVIQNRNVRKDRVWAFIPASYLPSIQRSVKNYKN